MVHEKLKELRISKGFSAKQLAIVLKISVEAYSSLESGKKDIGIKQLQLLSDFFEVPISLFLGERVETKIPAVREQKPEPAMKKSNAGGGAKSKSAKTSDKESIWGYGADGEPDRIGQKLKKIMDNHPEIPPEDAPMIELFSRIIYDITMEQIEDKGRLALSPEGYHPDKRKACQICNNFGSGKAMWYDAFGYKCMICQSAINKGLIPAEIATNEDLYYTNSTLDLHFNLNGAILKSWIKAGLLKPREIRDDENKKRLHYRLYLISDHQDFLPPPELLNVGHPVQETDENGRTEYVLGYPWYYFVDLVEYLKDYRIIKYLTFSGWNSPTGDEAASPEEGAAD